MTAQVPVGGGKGRHHAAAKSMMRTVQEKFFLPYERFCWMMAGGDPVQFRQIWEECSALDVAKGHAVQTYNASYKSKR